VLVKEKYPSLVLSVNEHANLAQRSLFEMALKTIFPDDGKK
jgi:hypothetical protein